MRPLTDRRSDAHRALQSLIRRAEHPQIHRALLCFAAVEALRPAVIDALRHPERRKHLGALLRQRPLLVVPPIRYTVRRIRRTGHLLPNEEGLRSCGVGEWRRMPRWLDALRLEPEARLEALDRVTVRDDRLTRLLGLRALMEEETPAAHRRIAALALDADPAIARTALRHLERQRWPEIRSLAAKLVHAEDPALRRLAERHLVPVGFDRLWQNWDRLQPGMRLTAARALVKIDPHFHHHLAGRLESEAPADRSRAVVLIRQLEQEREFESELLRRLEDLREGVAAVAAEALGTPRASPRVTEGLVGVLRPTMGERLGVSVIESLRQLGRLEEARPRLVSLSERAAGTLREEAMRGLRELDGRTGSERRSEPAGQADATARAPMTPEAGSGAARAGSTGATDSSGSR
jgi:hypothetical protein